MERGLVCTPPISVSWRPRATAASFSGAASASSACGAASFRAFRPCRRGLVRTRRLAWDRLDPSRPAGRASSPVAWSSRWYSESQSVACLEPRPGAPFRTCHL